jgi:hypothetical protein
MILTVKPHLGLLLPPLLALRGAWRTVAVAGLGVVLLVAASGILFGWGLWHDYLFKMSAFQAALMDTGEGFFFKMMPTVFPAARTAGLAAPAAWALQAVSAALATFLCWRAVRSGASLRALAFPAATATFLILPYAFNYDMTVVSLGVALLLLRDWQALGAGDRAIAIAAFLAPQLGLLLADEARLVVPAILLAFLHLQVRRCAAAANEPLPPEAASA